MIQKCRVCGCTEREPCDEGCCWVEYDLCSACVPKLEEATAAVIRWLAFRELIEPLTVQLDHARQAAAHRLRKLPKGLVIAGRRYKADPSKDEIHVGLSPRSKRTI